MKHLRKIVAGGILLLTISVFFGTRQPANRTQHQSQQLSGGEAPFQHGQAAAVPTRAKFPKRLHSSTAGAAQTHAPSALALRNFPNGKVIESRLEQLGVNEFRRTELIQTTLKYPFVRLETRFRLEGNHEVILGRHEVAADHVTVALKRGATEAELLPVIAQMGGTIRKKLNLDYAETYLIGLPEPTIDAVPTALEHLRAHSDLIAEADGDGVSRKAVIPNDTRFSQMWHLNNTGQVGGLRDADIDAAEAWSIHTGSPNVIIAVSDTGVNHNHPDLKVNMWTNTAERVNKVDDDRNGYQDDVRGWNFYDGNKDTLDTDGHGTFVSGIIGAQSNNGKGVSGMSWNCKIMPVRVLDTDGGFNSDIAEGFDYARRNGAKIINASHGGTGSAAMKSAVNNLEQAGVLLIAAAGNYGENTDSIPLDPASYTNPNVISVAATDAGDLLTSFSSYGASSVDLAAPGSGIQSTTMDNSYAAESGTSFSTPLVAGVAALLAAQNPGWDCFRIRTRILNNVDVIPNLNGKCVTGGRLNAYKALLQKVPLAQALDGSGLTWSSSGASPWIGGTLISHDRTDAAETGKVWHNQDSRVETTMEGPGRMSFWWKVSSEANYDFLIFYVDGSEIARISGNTTWAQRVHDLSSGQHTLTWRYVKDDSQSGGKDNGFLDEVIFLGVAPTIVAQPQSDSVYIGENATVTVGTTGTTPMSYQWRKNGTAISGATRSALTLNNVQSSDAGNYSVFVSNGAGSVTSATATLTVCNVALSSSSATFPAEGGNGNFNISVTGSCSWNAIVTNSWISSYSPASASGNATFEFTVAPNDSSDARAAFITIENRRFLIRQSGTSAPDNITGQTISMSVTNASEGLSAAGSFIMTTSSGGDANLFHMIPVTESVIAADQGTFSYSKDSSSVVTITLTGTSNYTLVLTFASPTSGLFTLHYTSGDTQSGTFNLRKAGLDFNGDLRNDLLLQNTKGVVLAWCMQGTEVLEAVRLRNGQPAATGWKVAAATDLLKLNEPQVILQGPTGTLAAWKMTNGTNFVEAVLLRNGTPLGAGWKVVSAADFNQDGNADLLLQHQDTRAAVWCMNGTEFLGAQHLRPGYKLGAGWRICGVSDFDGDGQSDILWQHLDGRLLVWHFVASDFVAVTNLRTAGVYWRAIGINDFNEDGKNDLLFQHQDRRLAVWFMDGTNFLSAALLRSGQPLSTSLRIAAPK